MRSWLDGGRTNAWTKLGLPLGGLLAFAVLGGSAWDDSLFAPTALETAALDPRSMAPAFAAATAPAPAAVETPDRENVLRRGQTLGAVLAELGLGPEQAHAAALATARYVDPRQLRPGARYAAYFDAGGELDRLRLTLEGKGELALERGDGDWLPSWRSFTRELRPRAIEGVLQGALENSIERAGADGELAYALADVLQWDLDFSRDLRHGDRFEVLFEEVWLEGRRHGLGNVLAATYEQPGRRLEVYRFGAGYYDADGRPLEKMFLRSPMAYSRITSRFSHRRLHPVLGAFRPHYGVDYGAPTGTPVRATAAGTVAFAGWEGGGGKTVKVRHPNDYLTGYLHLSKFAAGVRPGARVRQGEVIGYVGSTGLATGPHLDYRVQRRGQWIDPLSLKSVPAEPLSRLQVGEFHRVRDAMRASLETGAPFALPAPNAAPPTRLAAVSSPAAAGSPARK